MKMVLRFRKHFMASLQWYLQYGWLFLLVTLQPINYPRILFR